MTPPVNFTRRSSIGIDVHQNILVCHSKFHDGEKWNESMAQFGTVKDDVLHMANWCLQHSPDVVIMESTGVYWKAPYAALERAGVPVALVNPRQVRGMIGKKTDKKDASWLSTVGILGTYTPSYIPTEQWRDLRSSSRYLTKVIATRQAYKNRENKAFIDAGFRLNSVFSDPFGKNAQIAKDGILSGKTPEDILASIDTKRLKASRDVLLAAFNGELRVEHKLVIECTRSTIKFLENEIDKLREHIISKVKELELRNFMLLMTVPGFNELSAAQFIIEVGGCSFLEAFEDEEKFSSWVGVCPGNNESAGKRKSGRAPKGNLYLRRCLCEVSQAAVKTKGTTFKSKYESLSIRLGKKRSVFAIAHKITRVAYKVLSRGMPYRDPHINYAKLTAQRNCPRWIKSTALYCKEWNIVAKNTVTGEEINSETLRIAIEAEQHAKMQKIRMQARLA